MTRTTVLIELGVLIGVALYSYLPLILHQYSLPPGDDAIRLTQSLDPIHWKQRYYGHFPAIVIGMQAYFYMTILISYILLRAMLSMPRALLAWLLLVVGSRALMLDLSAGSFLAINNMLAGVLAITLMDKGKYKTVAVLLAVIPFWHAASGVYVVILASGAALLGQDKKGFLSTLPGLVGVAISAKYLSSVVERIVDATATGLASISTATSNGLVTYTRDYLTVGVVSLVLIVGLLILWNKGYHPNTVLKTNYQRASVIAVVIGLVFLLSNSADATITDRIGKYTLYFVVPLLTCITVEALLRTFRWSRISAYSSSVGLVAGTGHATWDLIYNWSFMGSHV